MRILVTNDDGLDATGIEVLEDIARELSDDVWVIAPAQDNSGASHSLTLHEPLRHSQHGEQKFSIHGTPTDCVIMGVRKFLGDTPPDLVLSGINHGQNIADDVTYSGTIAGAFEGAILEDLRQLQCFYLGSLQSSSLLCPVFTLLEILKTGRILQLPFALVLKSIELI